MEHVTSKVIRASLEKTMLLYVYIHFFVIFFVCFSSKKLCFLSFSFFFLDEVWNFRNGIFTNAKLELVIRNCQWNWMFSCLNSTKIVILENNSCKCFSTHGEIGGSKQIPKKVSRFSDFFAEHCFTVTNKKNSPRHCQQSIFQLKMF